MDRGAIIAPNRRRRSAGRNRRWLEEIHFRRRHSALALKAAEREAMST
jgi:hypothetical protein